MSVSLTRLQVSVEVSLIVLHCCFFDNLQSAYNPKRNGRKERMEGEREGIILLAKNLLFCFIVFCFCCQGGC